MKEGRFYLPQEPGRGALAGRRPGRIGPSNANVVTRGGPCPGRSGTSPSLCLELARLRRLIVRYAAVRHEMPDAPVAGLVLPS